jgi:membrane protein DedA with SNARE-associated domain
MLHTDLASYVSALSYLGIFLWFSIGEQLTPIPEEVSLISIGYLSVYASLNPFMAGLASLAGLLTTDNLLFFISLKGNKLAGMLQKKINNKILEKARVNLRRHAIKTIIVMAMIPKLRFLSPIISAISGISWKIFLVVNSAATAFNVAIYMLLGIFFHNQLHRLLRKLIVMQHAIFIVFMICFAVMIMALIKRNK